MTDYNIQNETSKVDLYIHTKVMDGRNTRIGSRIGVAFRHKDGAGMNIILDAQPIPVDGRIELVGFPPKPQNGA